MPLTTVLPYNTVLKFEGLAGFGSADTFIPYFTTLITFVDGGDFSYTNDSTNGLVVTILKAGLYSGWGVYQPTNLNGTWGGFSLNASESQRDSDITGITSANRLGLGQAFVSGGNQSSGHPQFTRYFNVGDQLRPHVSNTGINNWNEVNFARVG